MINTSIGAPINPELLQNYFHNLVNQFFKILPMREEEEGSLYAYMNSLQAELMGCAAFVRVVGTDPMFLSLLSILQYLIDNNPCEVCITKREVFKAISLCNKLQSRYGGGADF